MNISSLGHSLFGPTAIDCKLLVASAALLMGAASMAYGYYSALPTTQHDGNVTYITGGIGDEERTALESVSRDYNLHVLSAGRNGAFTGDTKLAIYDKMGNQVMMSEVGPMFYASLPPGKYTVRAVNEGKEQDQTVKLSSNNSTNIQFMWK